uniref:RNase III domain-containing protein n=1 Tax=Kalanchoe fedtschenkoi TaxID=63787 RepID=A0A7N0V5N8_KALFE
MKLPKSFFHCYPVYKSDSDYFSTDSGAPDLKEVEKLLGYKFKDKALLEKAFTHASVADVAAGGCESYERLEYVGDAVLNMLLARALYLWYPDLSPGWLTQLRAANVDTEKLARVAVKHRLYTYLRHHRGGKIDDQIEEFRKEMEKHPLHSMGLIKPPKVLADIVESLIGAISMDCGFRLKKLWPIVKMLLEPIISPETMKLRPKAELQELCQKKRWKMRYHGGLEDGEINVFVEDHLVGKASYSRSMKKEVAINHAAKDALMHLKTTTFVSSET